LFSCQQCSHSHRCSGVTKVVLIACKNTVPAVYKLIIIIIIFLFLGVCPLNLESRRKMVVSVSLLHTEINRLGLLTLRFLRTFHRFFIITITLLFILLRGTHACCSVVSVLLTVCPSVCLSHWYIMSKTTDLIIKQSAQDRSHGTRVYGHQHGTFYL